jgi:hypothetical protein
MHTGKILFSLLCLVPIIACKSKTANDWFPLKVGNKWTYKQASIQSKIPGDTEPQNILQESKVEFEIIGTTSIEGKEYFTYESKDGYRKKIIRYEDGNYFINDAITSDLPDRELLFLKDNLLLGETWEQINKALDYKIVFKVTKLEKETNVKGLIYKDTIEITREYYNKIDGSFVKGLTSKHIYAKGYGEVYSYIPYPLSKIYADDELHLEKFIPNNK